MPLVEKMAVGGCDGTGTEGSWGLRSLATQSSDEGGRPLEAYDRVECASVGRALL